MKSEQQILIGLKAISSMLGGTSRHTILKWVREYPSMPIRKIGDQWTATRGEIVEWWHCYVTDSLDEYRRKGPAPEPLVKGKVRQKKAKQRKT